MNILPLMPIIAANILLVVAAALVDADGRVLLATRPEGKSMPKSKGEMWEFPGGKLETHETPEQTLIRELKEELDIDVSASCLAPLSFASHAYTDFHLLMPLYACRKWESRPRPCEGQKLRWVRPRDMFDLDMPPANKPLIAILRDFL